MIGSQATGEALPVTGQEARTGSDLEPKDVSKAASIGGFVPKSAMRESGPVPESDLVSRNRIDPVSDGREEACDTRAIQ
jgi:hypothetical protein